MEKGFGFIHRNRRPGKPRATGLTEIRAAYYTPFGINYFTDLLDTMGEHIDSIKFAGGAFTLIPFDELQRITALAHNRNVEVSTGGFIEYVLTQGKDAVRKYIETCKEAGFDIIELSAGFISISTDDWLKLMEDVMKAGLKAKPEVGIQFGAGGASSAELLKQEGISDLSYAVKRARRFIEAGVYLVMIESEGITENVSEWRTEAPAHFINELGLNKLMFEAADPAVFEWYIKNYGPDVNLFVDHSQIVQLEAYRSGIWGTQSIWGRIVRY